ncbi:hypothetical protein KIPB_006018 [Kipferlia bialata]|uniref:Uncharacterized protein n=1 Tax=Kipferlia bialata TaxID=797122 RepID=A0A9K3CY14_9EUKA|nr:hypothetical protein KIPB_006018 [Kipferlia bialata]|eukprot:g6018.t1
MSRVVSDAQRLLLWVTQLSDIALFVPVRVLAVSCVMAILENGQRRPDSAAVNPPTEKGAAGAMGLATPGATSARPGSSAAKSEAGTPTTRSKPLKGVTPKGAGGKGVRKAAPPPPPMTKAQRQWAYKEAVRISEKIPFPAQAFREIVDRMPSLEQTAYECARIQRIIAATDHTYRTGGDTHSAADRLFRTEEGAPPLVWRAARVLGYGKIATQAEEDESGTSKSPADPFKAIKKEHAAARSKTRARRRSSLHTPITVLPTSGTSAVTAASTGSGSAAGAASGTQADLAAKVQADVHGTPGTSVPPMPTDTDAKGVDPSASLVALVAPKREEAEEVKVEGDVVME